jgi:hypothetical protein
MHQGIPDGRFQIATRLAPRVPSKRRALARWHPVIHVEQKRNIAVLSWFGEILANTNWKKSWTTKRMRSGIVPMLNVLAR